MRKKVHLASRIILMVSIALLVLLALNVFQIVSTSKKSVEATVGEQTVNIANNMLKYIDVDDYKALTQQATENDLYWTLREQLNELREKNGVLYAYTYFIPNEGEDVKFLVDGMPIDDVEGAAALGDVSSSTKYTFIEEVIKEGQYYSGVISGDYGEYISGFIPMKTASGEVVAILGVDIDSSYVESVVSNVAQSNIPIMIAIFVLLIVILQAVLYYYVNNTLKPLNILNASSIQLAEANIGEARRLISQIKVRKNNEIAQLTDTFSKTLETLEGSFSLIHEKTRNLETSVEGINKATVTASTASEKIAQSISSIVLSSEQQKASNEEVVVAMNEMTAGIQRLADTTSGVATASSDMTVLVEESTASSQKVIVQIQHVEQSVIRTSKHVEEMGERFNSIEGMVNVITNIADQTNLLALNAAIEAARAGEAGKGFAVVADEVRKLAEQSRHSADDIHQQLQSFVSIADRALNEMNRSTEDVKAGSLAVSTIGEKLAQILQSVEQVNDSIQEDSAIIQQMSASSEEVLVAAEQMNDLMAHTISQTQEVVVSMETQEAIIEQLNNVVQHLDTTSDNVVQEIERFKL